MNHTWVFAVCVLLSIPLANVLAQDPTNCVTPPSGLVAWWPGDGAALDLVSTNHGILQNGATYAEGKAGHAFNLDGIDDRVFIPESTTVDLSRITNWTIQAWVRPTSFSSKSYLTIYSEGYWGVSLGVDNPTGKPENWINNANQFIGAVTLQISNWNHVALTFDGTSRTFYVNGTFAGSSNSPVAVPDNNGAAIGDVAPTHSAAQFQGQIDEVALFNRALSSNEISAIYAAGTNGMCKDTLPPTILASPTNQYVALGSNVTLTVTAGGTPSLSYQWLFNGTNLSGAMASNLAITAAQTNQSGSYSVVVSNAYGTAVSPAAVLTVVPTPVITVQPQSQSWPLTHPVTFSVTVDSLTPLSYQWLRNGTNLAGATSATYTIAALQTNHLGTYAVRVSNLAGVILSSNATLTSRNPVWNNPENFENGWGDWYADNGVWEIGIPTYGPPTNALGLQAHSRTNCAGTVLGGNYPYETDSRLISPVIDLPAVGANEEVVLKFWQWFHYWYGYWSDGNNSGWGGNDYGEVQLQVYNTNTLQWSGWTNLLTVFRYSAGWTPAQADLTAYAEKSVRLGFYHVDATEDTDANRGTHHYESSGWYIDEVSIEKRPLLRFPGTDGFEEGWDGWFTDMGVWEVGAPTSGPEVAHSGTNCAGTVLGGNYPYETDSRLISPVIDLPAVGANEEVVLKFWQWFLYWYGYWSDGHDSGWGGNDYGEVQLQVYNTNTLQWSGWTNLLTVFRYSAGWTPAQADLTAYAEKHVRLGFYHVDATEDTDANYFTHHYESSGWYIDDVSIEKRPLLRFPGIDGFEEGWDGWFTDMGVWEVGAPTSGPEVAHSGTNCAGTVLGGNYPYETDSRLISPVIDLPAVGANEEVVLKFWQWFHYWYGYWSDGHNSGWGGNDYGEVQLQVYNTNTLQWSGWTNLLTVSYSSLGWVRPQVDLTAYTGQRVRLGFYHVDATEDTDANYFTHEPFAKCICVGRPTPSQGV